MTGVTTDDVTPGMVEGSTGYSEGAAHLAGGHHSQHNVSTPSTGTASKSSTR